jgi:hypothetical protein
MTETGVRQSRRYRENTRGRHRRNGLPNSSDPDARRHSGRLRNRVRSRDRTNRDAPHSSLYLRQRGRVRGAMASMFAVQVGELLPAKSPGRKADRSLGWRARRRRRVAVERERSLRRARLRRSDRSRHARTPISSDHPRGSARHPPAARRRGSGRARDVVSFVLEDISSRTGSCDPRKSPPPRSSFRVRYRPCCCRHSANNRSSSICR